MKLSPAQRLDWLRLIRSENVGPRTFRALINHCGSAGAALKAFADLARPAGARRPARLCPPDEAAREPAAVVEAVSASGAAVSEMALDYGPRGRGFPRRNRLISGLALGVIVVEAAQKSGSLITGRMALEQNRAVFAVPGSPLDPRAAGTNALLKQGAVMVTEAEDVLAALRPIIGGRVEPPRPERRIQDGAPLPDPPADARARIVALLGPPPGSADDLIRLSGAPTTMVQATLLELELAGRLKRQQGGRVALI